MALSTAEAAAKPPTSKPKKERRHRKTDSLIDIAAKALSSSNQIPEAPIEEPAQFDSVIAGIPLPVGLIKAVSKEAPPCVTEETPESPKQSDAEELQTLPNQTPEAPTKEPAQVDSVIDAIPLPSGLTKEASKEAPPCITEETPESPKQPDAEEPPKRLVAPPCVTEETPESPKQPNAEEPPKKLVAPPCVTEETPESPKQPDAEERPKELVAPPCVTEETPERPKQPNAEAPRKKLVAKFCPFCGGGLEAGFKFCRFCGSEMKFKSG